MRSSRFLIALRSWILRGWLLYALIALAAFFLLDVKKMFAHAGPSTLSRLRPDYNLMVRIVEGEDPFDRKVFRDQAVYLENVNAVMGERVDADILLAYCYYRLGDQAKSGKFFVRSLDLNPTFFWSYYDLALISLAKGDLDKATMMLRSAVKQDQDLSMRFFLSSHVFLPLASEAGYSPQKIYNALRRGYADAYKLLILLEFTREHFQDVAFFARTGMTFSVDDADRAFFSYFAGAAALRTDDLATAGRALEECLRIDPEHPEALANMGLLLERAGRRDMAAGFVAKAQLAKAKRGSALPAPQDFKIRVF